MTERIRDIIIDLQFKVFERIYQIRDVFQDYFGEDKVDLQSLCTPDKFESIVMNLPIACLRSDPGVKAYFDRLLEEQEGVDNTAGLKLSNLTGTMAEEILSILNPLRLVDILNSDIRGAYILVHFPSVEVTNENNRSIIIRGLYVKVPINYDGTLNGKFSMNRSEYSLAQFNAGYLHSHVSSIPHDASYFQQPCLGNGPIVSTSTTLYNCFDIDIWKLYCLELDRYVHTESLKGGPYRRLEQVFSGSTDNSYRILGARFVRHNAESTILNMFLKYFIKLKKLKFRYNRGYYTIAMSPVEYALCVSNSFIEWYNSNSPHPRGLSYEALLANQTLVECGIANGKLYHIANNNQVSRAREFNGQRVCTFKGEEVTVRITDVTEDSNKVTILSPDILSALLTRMLLILNYKYGRSKEEFSDTNEAVRYL